MRCILTTLIKLLILSFLVGCGVKGRPLPPEDQPELNRGRVGFELEGFKNQSELERQNKKSNAETALDKSMNCN